MPQLSNITKVLEPVLVDSTLEEPVAIVFDIDLRETVTATRDEADPEELAFDVQFGSDHMKCVT